MKENLEKSLDAAITFQKLMETFRDILKQLLSENQDLSDELIVTMVVAYNGTGNLLVKLFDVMELLTERKSVFGTEGMDKKINARVVEDQLDEEEEEDDETEEEE